MALLAELTGTAMTEWDVSPPGDGPAFVTQHPVRVEPPFLSLSHDGSRVACAASWYGPVGIDVQRDRPAARLRAIASFLGWPNWLAETGDARALTLAWATWEACAKASGRSVLGPVPAFPATLELLRNQPGAGPCKAQRLADGWLAVVSLPPSPEDTENRCNRYR